MARNWKWEGKLFGHGALSQDNVKKAPTKAGNQPVESAERLRPRRLAETLAIPLIIWAVCAWGAPTWRVAAQGQTSTVWRAVYSTEQASRGEEAYNQECASCHLVDLSGDEYAPPLNAGFFEYRWTDKTLEELFLKMATTMPQDKPGALDKGTYAEILAYILKVNGFPAGQTPLAKDPAALRQIRITSKP